MIYKIDLTSEYLHIRSYLVWVFTICVNVLQQVLYGHLLVAVLTVMLAVPRYYSCHASLPVSFCKFLQVIQCIRIPGAVAPIIVSTATNIGRNNIALYVILYTSYLIRDTDM